MKTTKQNLHNILLAAVMVLPLGTVAHSVQAADFLDNATDAAPAPHGGPGMMPPPGGPGGMQHGPGMGGPGRDMGPGGPGMGPGAPGMHGAAPFLRGVELSEAQQDKVFGILYAQEPYLREQGKTAAKAREALRAMSGAAQYDDAKAAAAAQAEAQAMANIALQWVRTEQKLLAVLTPEQRKAQAEAHAHRAPHAAPHN